MCCSHGQLFVCVLTAHINQHYSTVLCGIKSCDCLLLQLHDPNDVIKTTKVKVAAFRTAICSNHKINCTLKFSINTGRGVGVWVQKRHSKQGPMASKQLVASQVTPPPQFCPTLILSSLIRLIEDKLFETDTQKSQR